MNYSGLQWLAGVALGRMLFCLVEGTVLALVVALAVRMLAGKSSQTRFVLGLTALVASAAMPALLVTGWSKEALSGVTSSESVTIPAQVAMYVFLVWTGLASAGLVRVAVGVAGLRRLRKASRELDLELLVPGVRAEIEEFEKKRKVRLLVSSQMNVPTAIGFFRPAIVLPEWLLEEGAEEDLKHVVLHELAHLRRWDDWTNLLQKVIKALLFFHPAIWWMERRVSLDREMACDDAVLASTGSPRIYAELLARMAEKSFLRRQMELAQAAVGRLRQLSRRVARILDPKRPAAGGLWKPAVPALVALAIVSSAGLSWVPGLVKVESSPVVAMNGVAPAKSVEIPAPLKSSSVSSGPSLYHQAKLTEAAGAERKQRPAKAVQSPQTVIPRYQAAKQSGAANAHSGFVLLVETQQTLIATPTGWRVSVIETRWLIPAKAVRPQPPNKT